MKLIIMNILLVLTIVVMAIDKKELDIPKLTAQHVVMLEDDQGSGTGFYVMFNGKSYLLSNKHVCRDVHGLNNGEGFQKVIALSTEHDLCLLESNRKTGLEIDEKLIESLDKVYVLGHPLGNKLTAREGRFVSNFFETFPWIGEYPVEVMHISVTAFGGSSGSPIVNEHGKLVGVLFATDDRTYEDSLGVPMVDVVRFLNTHIH